MHVVKYTIRTILPAELPTVREPGGTTRPATEGELLNLGLVPLGNDLYSCVDQYRRDPDTLTWRAEGPESPGTIVSEGSLRERHARLPADVRGKILRARIVRVNAQGKEQRLTLPMAAVRPTDVVEESDVIPHQWHGESKR